MDSETILSELQHFTGSETFLRDSFPLRNALLTDGFQEFLKLCECEWLYSDMAIVCRSKFLNKEDFIICKIVKDQVKSSCDVFLYSDKQHLLYTQHYSYTDFPLKEYEFYICFNGEGFTFMLKPEY